ncbi:MAG: hypothetical protein Kow001_01240 [Acidobacteriota bacterium]
MAAMRHATFLLGLVLALAMSAALLGAADQGGNGWLPDWAEQLGVSLERTPAPDEVFTTLRATVTHPEKLIPLLAEAKEGMVVTFTHAGYAAWMTEVSGIKIRPCVVRLQVEGSETEVRLVPDRKTLQLKVGPPPFRGSNLRPGGR